MTKQSKGESVRLRSVVIIYLVLLAVNFLFVNYTKVLVTYNDEYYYMNIARNIFRGEGAVIDGVNNGFDKVMYSFVIAPAYFITNAAVRVKVISFINCVLMSASLFPVWLMARDIKLSRENTMLALAMTCVFPELSLSMSFMSENLFFPLVLVFIRFWLAGSMDPSKKNAVITGVLGFLCFFCKASFLAVMLAWAVFEVIFPALSCLTEGGKSLRGCYKRERLIYFVVAAAIFAGLNVIIKFVLFNGAKSAYQVRSITSILEPYRLCFAVYAAVYIIAGLMISALILPFVYPLLQYSKLNEPSKRLFCFNLLSILVTAAVVVYTISIHEDYGTTQPEVHVRYFAHFILVSFILFLKSTETGYNTGGSKRPGYWTAVVMSAVLPCAVYRGMQASGPEMTLLKFYGDYSDAIGSLSINSRDWLQEIKGRNQTWLIDSPYPLEIPLYAVLFGLIMTAVVCVFHGLFTGGRERTAVKLGACFIIIIMAVNSVDSRIQWRFRNTERTGYLQNVTATNEYFAGNNESFNMLYITGNRFNKSRCAVDSYLNLKKGQHIYTMESSWLGIEELAANDFVIRDTRFRNTCGYSQSSEFFYDAIEDFDYILIDDTSGLVNYRLSGVTCELEAGSFTLYSNDDPATLIFERREELAYSGGSMEIFSDNYLTADYNVTDSGNVYTNDIVIEIEVPVQEGADTFDVHVELENKQDSYQLFMARQGGSEIHIDAVSGNDTVDFTAHADSGVLSLEILLPNAKINYLDARGTYLIKNSSCPISKIVIQETSPEE